MTIVAHSDDQIIGPGGTLVKYVNEGKKVITVIFSYGEKSHPHFKKEVIQKIRVEESERADNVIGGSGVIFLGIDEGKFKEQFNDQEHNGKLEALLLKYKPKKIFTHAIDDSHPDHKAVNALVLELYDKLHRQRKLTADVYTFGVWRLFRFKKTVHPRVVVNISQEFRKKLQALRAFKSQWITFSHMRFSIYFKALLTGIKHGYEFAEEFYKRR